MPFLACIGEYLGSDYGISQLTLLMGLPMINSVCKSVNFPLYVFTGVSANVG